MQLIPIYQSSSLFYVWQCKCVFSQKSPIYITMFSFLYLTFSLTAFATAFYTRHTFNAPCKISASVPRAHSRYFKSRLLSTESQIFQFRFHVSIHYTTSSLAKVRNSSTLTHLESELHILSTLFTYISSWEMRIVSCMVLPRADLLVLFFKLTTEKVN